MIVSQTFGHTTRNFGRNGQLGTARRLFKIASESEEMNESPGPRF